MWTRLRSALFFSLPAQTVIQRSAALPSLDVVRMADKLARTTLQQRGIQVYMFKDQPPLLERQIQSGASTAAASGAADSYLGLTHVYELEADSVPPPKKSWVEEHFALHPGFKPALSELQKLGFRVCIDSSLDPLRVQGYTDVANRMVAVRPGAKWHTFVHEKYHAWFGKQVMAASGATTIAQLPSRLFSLSGPALEAAQRAVQLLQRGYPELAVYERLAIDEEIRAFRMNNINAWSLRIMACEDYALQILIESLRAQSEPLTNEQRKLLRSAVLRRWLWTRRGTRYMLLLAVALGGASLVAWLYERARDGRLHWALATAFGLAAGVGTVAGLAVLT